MEKGGTMTQRPEESPSMSVLLKEGMPLIGSLTVLIGAGGFIVVELSLLVRYNVFVPNVVWSRFVGAGLINLVLFVVSFIVFEWIMYKNMTASYERVMERKPPTFDAVLMHDAKVATTWWGIRFIATFLLVFGIPDALIFYPNIPAAIGGGAPTDVILVFKDSITSTGLPVTVDSTNPKRSQRLQKVMDLSDGLLVFDETSGTTLEVKGDMLAGIVAFRPAIAATATATTISTANPVPSSSPATKPPFTPTP